MTDKESNVPAWAKWALGIAQVMILALMAWICSTLLGLYTSVNLNTYKLNQVQNTSTSIQTMQEQIQQLQWQYSDVTKVQTDHETRITRLENERGVRVKGWTH